MSQEPTYKLLIVGESGVGKTCMLLQFADNSFEENFLSTIGVDFKVKEISVDGKKVKLQIWDSAGQESFKNITTSYYRNSSGLIIVYDITDHESFKKISDWVEEVRQFVPNAPLILVGNKCDMEEKRQVFPDEGRELAKNLKMEFIETSAKTAYNIEEAFKVIAKQLIAESASQTQPSNTRHIDLKATSKKKNKC
ncbi:ras-related protein Rab-13 [Histomonas meleagridis]|uniref:ras-related protein Rab-13 n=1 Tax=Histomonas meleagridis TaxID=135588 RepID=UPI003559EF9E|nr:ras-related protein Rab-13 [Histomonas meleagridis]KAH0799072.1 ras-related protein Rab-13 [Histomonas meleagridis]